MQIGQATAISWSVVVPGGCVVEARLNGQLVAKTGSRSVFPVGNTTFKLVISERFQGVYSERFKAVQVTVSYPARIVIDPSTHDPVAVLLAALQDSPNPHQTVELCNVDLDLTGKTEIEINDNRELIASPDCARGPRSLGPRIFVTDKRGSNPLFTIRGDNIRFSGFRLEGPTSDIAQGNDKEVGIKIWPFGGNPAPIQNIEISNMEIFHWSGVGVEVGDNVEAAERGRLFNTNPGAVRVRGNFFHHNRHGAGEGYGVASIGGAYVTIEQNVFDENRHAIAGGSRNTDGDGRDYSGYTARDNLILSGGGVHCADSAGNDSIWGGVIGGILFGPLGAYAGVGAGIVIGSSCFHTHMIDMHGDGNLPYSSNNWECGTAGETMIIERNTILYDNGTAIKIRGNPADKAVVDNNVFKHENRSDAIDQSGDCGLVGDNITNPIDVRPTNVFNADPMAHLGTGDFFGDGQLEQFMATGVTWWAKSPVTGQWRYLNTMKEQLSEVVLVKLDNDSICDVALRPSNPYAVPTTYSKSGTGPWQPWRPIETRH